jgi:acylphosphatase
MIVKGNVQAVGFRYYTKRLAEQFGVTGEVWNRRDGSVEIVAHHLRSEHLATFRESLYLGPGRVDEIAVSQEEDGPITGFTIGPTR